MVLLVPITCEGGLRCHLWKCSVVLLIPITCEGGLRCRFWQCSMVLLIPITCEGGVCCRFPQRGVWLPAAAGHIHPQKEKEFL